MVGAVQVKQVASHGSHKLFEFNAKPALHKAQIEVVVQFKQFASSKQAPDPTYGCFFFFIIV